MNQEDGAETKSIAVPNPGADDDPKASTASGVSDGAPNAVVGTESDVQGSTPGATRNTESMSTDIV